MTTDLVRSFTDGVWNQRRLDLLDGLVVDDYVLRNLADGSIQIRGRASLREHIEEWLTAFPDLRLHETDHLANGERAVSFARITGTHSGAPFLGFQPAGAQIDVAIVAIFDGDGERLVSHGTLLDSRRILDQLTAGRGP